MVWVLDLILLKMLHVTALENSFRRRFAFGLPEFNPVAFGIDDPSEFAIFIFLSLIVDFHALPLKLIQQSVEILNPEVDHERRRTRIKVLRVVGKIDHTV